MNRSPSILEQSVMAARLLTGLPRFLHQPPQAEASKTVLQRALRDRSTVFLELVRRGIYEHASSPYLPLLHHARLGTFDRFAGLVHEHGVEGTLDRLYDAGVRVTLDEFKGRRAIVRGGLTIPTQGSAFDNPLLTKHFEAQTGGSRSPGSRFIVDLELLAHDGHYDRVFLDMFDLASRPGGLWHPAPPGAAGLKWALRLARLGHPLERWFSQTPVSFQFNARNAALVRAIASISRLSGRAVPMPRHVSLAEAATVVDWLAECRERGTPAWLSTTASCAVRLCREARSQGVDISGTFFRASGEPLSPGKARAIAEAGCVARCHYAMAEIGRMGVACGNPSNHDSVHLVSDKVAFLQRDLALSGGTHVPALVLTTLLWSVPKVMLNVELGDYAVRERRQCGCAWDSIGFAEQLHTIRSYEKLTSEGMHFVGADLIALVDEVLPSRFGGDPTDYQFVEEEQDGIPTVSLVVSDRVGPVNLADVQSVVLDALAALDAPHEMMSGLWRDGGTLRVVRGEPRSTNAGKILALHVAGATSR